MYVVLPLYQGKSNHFLSFLDQTQTKYHSFSQLL
jgi:hypothetical protein